MHCTRDLPTLTCARRRALTTRSTRLSWEGAAANANAVDFFTRSEECSCHKRLSGSLLSLPRKIGPLLIVRTNVPPVFALAVVFSCSPFWVFVHVVPSDRALSGGTRLPSRDVATLSSSFSDLLGSPPFVIRWNSGSKTSEQSHVQSTSPKRESAKRGDLGAVESGSKSGNNNGVKRARLERGRKLPLG